MDAIDKNFFKHFTSEEKKVATAPEGAPENSQETVPDV
jgi:hypothetical protein